MSTRNQTFAPAMGSNALAGWRGLEDILSAWDDLHVGRGVGRLAQAGLSSKAARKTTCPTAAARKVLQVTNFWFGIGAQGIAPHQASALDAIEIEGALLDGNTVHWGEWTMRPTPPRHEQTSDGEKQWIATIWVSSPHGCNTFVWSNLGCIESICRYIRKKKVAATELAMVEDPDDDANL